MRNILNKEVTMSLPPEIVEKILINCDGRTLINAKHVCKQWRSIVEFLSNKTEIWRWCCETEIPEKELITYLNSFNNYEYEPDIWFFIYKTWLSYQNLHEISFDIIPSPVDIPRITCIDIYDNYIAVGSEGGRVRIFNQYWKLLSLSRHQAEKVNKVTFLYNEQTVKIVIAYPKLLIIDDIYGEHFNHLTIEDVVNHSIYKDCICYQKLGGRLTIEKLNGNREGRFLDEIWFTRVYSPSNITCINMWHGICTILINNDVRKLDYDIKNMAPISNLPTKCYVNYSMPNSLQTNIQQILRDDIIIVLYRADRLEEREFIEVVMLGRDKEYAKKLFYTNEVLEGSITCICLYGNTMVLGVDTGIVYFYHIPSWKHFSIKAYQKRFIIGKHPITNIVVKETKFARKFYITSSFNIHEIVGFSLNF